MLVTLAVRSLLARGLVVAAALAAAWQCARLAWAERRFLELTRPAIDRALALDPGNSLYWTTLAQLQQRGGENPRNSLRRAASLNPYDAVVRIKRGLYLEAAGDLVNAERELLEAARLSRKYEPRWTLSNFYFRRGNEKAFQRWATEALRVSYGDRAPLFDLWSAMGVGLGTVAEALPPARETRLALVHYAWERSRVGEVASLVRELAEASSPPERPAFKLMAETLATEDRLPEALDIWRVVDPGEPPFSWRASSERGIGVFPDSAGGWSVSLDGTQPERVDLLSKLAPVTPGDCKLDLRWTGGIEGLRWFVEPAGGGEDLGLAFHSSKAGVVRIALRYQRPAGSVRKEAHLEIERALLDCEP